MKRRWRAQRTIPTERPAQAKARKNRWFIRSLRWLGTVTFLSSAVVFTWIYWGRDALKWTLFPVQKNPRLQIIFWGHWPRNLVSEERKYRMMVEGINTIDGQSLHNYGVDHFSIGGFYRYDSAPHTIGVDTIATGIERIRARYHLGNTFEYQWIVVANKGNHYPEQNIATSCGAHTSLVTWGNLYVVDLVRGPDAPPGCNIPLSSLPDSVTATEEAIEAAVDPLPPLNADVSDPCPVDYVPQYHQFAIRQLYVRQVGACEPKGPYPLSAYSTETALLMQQMDGTYMSPDLAMATLRFVVTKQRPDAIHLINIGNRLPAFNIVLQIEGNSPAAYLFHIQSLQNGDRASIPIPLQGNWRRQSFTVVFPHSHRHGAESLLFNALKGGFLVGRLIPVYGEPTIGIPFHSSPPIEFVNPAKRSWVDSNGSHQSIVRVAFAGANRPVPSLNVINNSGAPISTFRASVQYGGQGIQPLREEFFVPSLAPHQAAGLWLESDSGLGKWGRMTWTLEIPEQSSPFLTEKLQRAFRDGGVATVLTTGPPNYAPIAARKTLYGSPYTSSRTSNFLG